MKTPKEILKELVEWCILNNKYGFSNAIEGALKDLDILMPNKKCSIWNTFKLNKIREWQGLKTCAECHLNDNCESRIRNKVIDEIHRIYKGK